MVDDDRGLGELLTDYFARFGHRLTAVATAAEGRRRLETDVVDLVILDVQLPDGDGFALCREWRPRHPEIPILMLTARDGLPDRVLGYELGADDYVPKPFEPRELVARIEARLRPRRSEDAVLRAGGLNLDPATRRVILDGSEVPLTTAEFDLLEVLVRNAGRVLRRARLLECLGDDVEDRSIDMAISRLRSRLGDDPRAPRFVATVRGLGYQFVGDRDPAQT